MTKCLSDQEMVLEEWESDACGTDLTMGRGYKISWNRSWSHSIHIHGEIICICTNLIYSRFDSLIHLLTVRLGPNLMSNQLNRLIFEKFQNSSILSLNCHF